MTTLIAELSRDQGRLNRLYTDTVGKITAGVGRNLTDVGFSEDEVELMLKNDIQRTQRALDKNLPWWKSLDPVRQRVLLNMAFNMGAEAPGQGLLGFKNTLRAMEMGDYAAAAEGMLASKWATQVGARAVLLAAMMLSGKA